MSKLTIRLDAKRQLRFGFDRPFDSYFAQLWDTDFDPDFEFGAPAKAAGYHPAEQIPPLAGEYGPFPLRTRRALNEVLEQWEIPPTVRARVAAYRLKP